MIGVLVRHCNIFFDQYNDVFSACTMKKNLHYFFTKFPDMAAFKVPATKQLLQEVQAQVPATVHDWVFNPNEGFFRYIGRLSRFLGITNNHNTLHSPFFHHTSSSTIIRVPGVSITSILGLNLGVYGALLFSKLYSKHGKSSLLYLLLSNLFFSGMNASALLFHCLLPKTHSARFILRYADQVCTGIAGVFMGHALRCLTAEKQADSSGMEADLEQEARRMCAVVAVAAVLPMVHPALGDAVYFGGLSASVLQLIRIRSDSAQGDELRGVRRMANSLLLVVAVTGVGVLGRNQLARLSQGKLNVMNLMFATYHGAKLYQY